MGYPAILGTPPQRKVHDNIINENLAYQHLIQQIPLNGKCAAKFKTK